MARILAIVASTLLAAACSSPTTSVCAAHGSRLANLDDMQKLGWDVSEAITISQIEAEAMEERREYRKQPHARQDVPMVPFGFANQAWLGFKSRVELGDEIRKISAPQVCWQNLSGWEGFVLLRDGQVVGSHMTLIN